jgi:hypothetical protein
METDDPSHVLSSKEIIDGTRSILYDKGKAFIRFTGGEPTLQWSSLIDVLNGLSEAYQPYKVPILIQTNGIEIGKGVVSLDILTKDPNQPFIFELSFKGTNRNEFSLLTGKPEELFDYQIYAYKILSDLSFTNNNICVVAVLGVYHSSTHGTSKFAFVNPKTGQLLFEDNNLWDPQFKSNWQSASLKWVEPLRMSPKGVWTNVLERCGTSGACILNRFPEGVPTNVLGLFPAKPKSADYARQIIIKRFWQK